MNKSKYGSEREITWINVDKRKLSEIKEDLIKDQKIYTINIDLSILGIKFTINSDKEDYITQIKQLFDTNQNTGLDKEITQLDNIEKERLIRYRFDISNIKSKYVGLFNEKNYSALVLGKRFGLFKSVILGFASSIAEGYGYHPAHASLCNIDGKGIMLSGGHNAGKTTSLLHLLYIANKEKETITDDWVLVNENNEEASSFENTISFTQDFCKEFPYLGLTKYFERYILHGNKKVYITPNKLYNQGISTKNSKIDVVVLLEPVNRDSLITSISIEDLVDNIIENTYHMPDCNLKNVKLHKNFWTNFLISKKIYSFDTRHNIPTISAYKQLYDYLMGVIN